MAHPQVANGGDSPQIRRVAVNILKKQSQTANRGGPTGWELGGSLQLLSVKKTGKVHASEYTKIPKVFFTPLHDQ
jgi:hypothetical protein